MFLYYLPPQMFDVGKDERKVPLGRPGHTQDDSNDKDLGLEGVDGVIWLS
jgi:hypothetical protein